MGRNGPQKQYLYLCAPAARSVQLWTGSPPTDHLLYFGVISCPNCFRGKAGQTKLLTVSK